MIDNICMIIQGVLNQKAPKELSEKVHPLCVFEGMWEIMLMNGTCVSSFTFER